MDSSNIIFLFSWKIQNLLSIDLLSIEAYLHLLWVNGSFYFLSFLSNYLTQIFAELMALYIA